LAGETCVGEVVGNAVRLYQLTPEDFGLERAPLSVISGGDAKENAEILRGVLEGERGPCRDIVVANAAAALVAAGRSPDFLEGALASAQSIDTGAAAQKLDALIAFTAPRS